MADFDNQPSPPPSSSPPSHPPSLPAAGKRKDPPTATATATATTSNPSPPNKRPNIPPPPPPTAAGIGAAAPSVDVDDTAASKPPDAVQIGDRELLQSIVEYRNTNGHFPFKTPAAMEDFLFPYTVMNMGTEEGWKERIEKLEKKFDLGSQPVEEEDKDLFDLWMKIWGNEGGDDHDPSGGGAVGV